MTCGKSPGRAMEGDPAEDDRARRRSRRGCRRRRPRVEERQAHAADRGQDGHQAHDDEVGRHGRQLGAMRFHRAARDGKVSAVASLMIMGPWSAVWTIAWRPPGRTEPPAVSGATGRRRGREKQAKGGRSDDGARPNRAGGALSAGRGGRRPRRAGVPRTPPRRSGPRANADGADGSQACTTAVGQPHTEELGSGASTCRPGDALTTVSRYPPARRVRLGTSEGRGLERGEPVASRLGARSTRLCA